MSLLHICEHTFLSLETARTWTKFWSCWSQSSTRPRCASISPWFAVVNCGNVAALETASGAAAARQCRWRTIRLYNAQLPFRSPMLGLNSRYCTDIPYQRIYLNSDFPVPRLWKFILICLVSFFLPREVFQIIDHLKLRKDIGAMGLLTGEELIGSATNCAFWSRTLESTWELDCWLWWFP